ncbi:LIC_10421 family protein [Leptospira sp. GIMC2001]|uniref:LIC_10421 family protein n=1 Tax=Leptospira sp. GIMC2001 TaxID=1513297 RepID=UPI002349AB9B|nr:hypothetical protein [Leptospira sp. GIMC2001]WCL48940.1 hypothetical protein O4O04_16830 [Leptospira sp. GIMC2001]
MKITKILISLLIIQSLSSFSFLFALDQSTKLRLMEEALIESAITPEQKSAVAAYMNKIAEEKLALAQKLRERANSPRAGKVAYKNAERKELIRKAERLESEAKRYKDF